MSGFVGYRVSQSRLVPPRELVRLLRREGLDLDVPPYWGLGRTLRDAEPDPVAYLVPARTDTAWWWDYCRWGEIRFLRGRVRFEGERSGAPFPSAVVIFGRLPAVYGWDWRAGLEPVLWNARWLGSPE